MAKTKSNILLRTATALIMAPLVIAGLYFGYPYVVLMLLSVGALLAWEWSAMVANKRPSVYAVIYTASVAVALMLNSWLGICIMLLSATLLVWFKAKDEEHRRLLTLGVPYITVGIGSLMWIYYITAFHILCFVLIIWATDIGGYVVGKSVKGPKLAPKISPNKTWSGLFGGMALAALCCWGYLYFFGLNDWRLAVAGALLAVLEQIGDLVESAIKRYLGVKDSGTLIPGHGGVFDRIDGMIFTAPFVYLILAYWFSI